MDQTDYVLMRAPKPTLICSTTKDFFDIEGTWDTFRQSKRFYAQFGQPEQVDLVETPGGHGVTQTGREAIVRCMQRWLLGIDKDVTDPGGKVWTEAELQCTPKGQVLLLAGEKSVFDLNVERGQVFAKEREAFAKLPPNEARDVIRRVVGVRKLEDIPEATFRIVGRAQVNGYEIRKLVMEVDDGVAVPILRILPEKPSGVQTLYLSDAGKAGCLENPLVIKELEDGNEIWALDFRGMGELRHPSSNNMLGDWKTSSLAYLLGKSLVGQRCEDLMNFIRFMHQMAGKDPKPINEVLDGAVHITNFHVSALLGADVFGITSSKSLPMEPWMSICRGSADAKSGRGRFTIGNQNDSEYPLANTIHGVLMHYEINDVFNLK
jgi:hypothetical protein